MVQSPAKGESKSQRESASPVQDALTTVFGVENLVAALIILTTFLLCVFPNADTDFWWHLRTGQLIWERGAVPRTDWYLFTDSDKPWIDLHWGFQLLMAAVYGLGGVNLVILVKAAAISTAVGVAWFAAGKDLPAWQRSLVWIPAMICISGRGYERPEMLSLWFLAGWLWVAFRAEARPRWVWTLPVIQLVWVNCHALFVLGLVVGGCFAVDFCLRTLASGRFGLEPVSQELKPKTVFVAGAACAAAAVCNPYFIDGALFPFVLYRKFSVEQEFYSARIGEFQSPFVYLLRHGPVNLYLNAQILLSVLGIVSFAVLLLEYRRWSPFRLVLFAGFLNLGWEASRNVNIFALVAATLTVGNLADRKRRSADSGQRTAKPADALSSRVRLRRNFAICTLFAAWIVFIVTGGWGILAREKKLFGLGERPWWFAHEAVTFAGQPGFPDRAYVAHIGIAATYEFHHGPEKKVFMDPRLEVVSQETFLLWEHILLQMSQANPSWEPLVKDAAGELPVVILDREYSGRAISGMMRTRGWRMVYVDPAATVFLSEPQARALNLPPVTPGLR